jgi:periplasmic copper chaperone A
MKIKFLIAMFALIAQCAWAQTVVVSDAWARSVVAGQGATGAFMKLQSKEGAKLVGASSPVAGVVQVHQMSMQGDVMKMSPVAALDLPAGQTVELKPGSYHVMLMDLKQGLENDSVIELTLNFQDATGKAFAQTIKVPVKAMQGGEHHHHAM